MDREPRSYSVTEIVTACSSTLEMNFERVVVEGEVASYKINQGKYVFFDLKDEQMTLPCFMMLFQLRMPVQDGMKVRVVGTPKITAWGRFSFTVQQMMPVGEGDIKKSFELLKRKLAGEGLFDAARKRPLPARIEKIGVISSTQAAGYADFVKILNERWGGLEVQVIHTQVQGMGAAGQIVAALQRFNERGDRDVVAILRGGGSADDLAAFNDEELARAIAASKTVVVTGIGHEVDESLADLAADVRASTPSNAAQMLTREKRAEQARVAEAVVRVREFVLERIAGLRREVGLAATRTQDGALMQVGEARHELDKMYKILEQLNPERVLARGYALVSGRLAVGGVVKITTDKQEMDAEIKAIKERNKS